MVELGRIIEFIYGRESAPELYYDFEITGVNSLELATEHELTFFTKKASASHIKSKSRCTIVKNGIDTRDKSDDKILIMVDNPRLEFSKVAFKFFPPDIYNCTSFNDKFDYSTIGNVVFTLHNRHDSNIIGGEGFGFERDKDGKLYRFPHYGGVRIANNVTMGYNNTIDRGTFDDTIIEEGTKLDSNIHIAHNVKIGKHCLIVSHVEIMGSVEIGDYCFIGAGCVIKDHVKIGNNVMVGAMSYVNKDICDNVVVSGNPARIIWRKKENEIY